MQEHSSWLFADIRAANPHATVLIKIKVTDHLRQPTYALSRQTTWRNPHATVIIKIKVPLPVQEGAHLRLIACCITQL